MKTHVGRFLAARTAAGQAAQALRELEQIATDLAAQRKPVSAIDATLHLDAADPAVETFLGIYSRPSITWADLAWLRARTRLPILLKGVLRADDAVG